MPTQPDQLWEAIRAELRRETPDFKFHIWLEPLELAAVVGRTLYIRAPDHIRTSVAERYMPLLRRAAASRLGHGATMEIVDTGWQPADEHAATEAQPRTGLNPKYTFEQFVIGSGNRFAHAAALAAAELPAQAYNPLFLYGSPGTGKTHLLHAIGNYVSRYGAGLRVRYTTIEEFTREFVEALRARRTADFKDRFRAADVVLIDDVQFLAGRVKTREEFFHTFNVLLDSGRQLVMTSDRRPEELRDLEARLTERFRCGLVAELEAPAPEVRRAILHARARLDGIEVPDEVLEEIAMGVGGSVRALEGALIRVVAYASLKGERPTIDLARHVLRRLDQATGQTRLDVIIDAVAAEFRIDREVLLGRDRRPEVSRARQVAMYVARELAGLKPTEIGRGIGDRSHATVDHAIKSVRAGLHSDPAIRSAVDNLQKRLQQPAHGRAE
ncbi:MAG: chromosomal replication initiator protein DnaA [Thermoleophilaceae bacterium]|nr:chromosomal replication initiator protein DnaA [Thermoleophilaceae bacterium]